MGGEGSIVTWANEQDARAQKDYVHLTRDGYAFLGNFFAQDLVRAYTGWRLEQGLGPTVAPAPPQVAPSPAPVPIATRP
jgi:hypothetical protein